MRGPWWVVALLATGCLSVPGGGADGGGSGGDGGIEPVDLAPITRIAGGRRQFCAIGAGGHVACWGDTRFVDVTGTAGGNPTPALVRDESGAPLTGATAIAVGDQAACALIDGTPYCWGGNDTGQLGRGVRDSEFHAAAPAQLSSATALTVGGSHACALTGDALSCWGRAASGELGNGVTGQSALAPVEVIASGCSLVAAGGHHTCVVTEDDTRCVGQGDTSQIGQLGDSANFVSLVSLGAASAIAASLYHTCALVDGGLWCWGLNTSGQLGDGQVDAAGTSRAEPVLVANLGTCFPVALDAEGAITCTACLDGEVRCWGAGGGGRLGIGSSPSTQPVPTPVVGLEGRDAKQVAVGTGGGCALDSDGAVSCWGSNEFGELGTGAEPVPGAFVVSAAAAIDFSAVE